MRKLPACSFPVSVNYNSESRKIIHHDLYLAFCYILEGIFRQKKSKENNTVLKALSLFAASSLPCHTAICKWSSGSPTATERKLQSYYFVVTENVIANCSSSQTCHFESRILLSNIMQAQKTPKPLCFYRVLKLQNFWCKINQKANKKLSTANAVIRTAVTKVRILQSSQAVTSTELRRWQRQFILVW